MMLSIEKPELYEEVLRFPGGIHCFRAYGESIPRIVIKLPINCLLPAKINRGFKIYIVPVVVSGGATVGLMCAFFDDSDSPLVCWRMLDSGAETDDLVHAVTRRVVLVHLFDDHGREWLGYRAEIDLPLVARIRLEHAKHLDFSGDNVNAHSDFNSAHEQAMSWFGLRTPSDDDEAMHVRFVEPLFPEDLVVSDVRPDRYQYQGSKGFALTSLERTEPGPSQELDIVLLLQRVFRPEQIYHAPLRHHDKEEIADVLVITDDIVLIVQAKDSPNTEKMLNRTLDRKRRSSAKQLKEALVQIVGAINYVRKQIPLRMFVGKQEVSIDIGGRRVLALAVVRELFSDMYVEYTQIMCDAFERGFPPCIPLDYQELDKYTFFCPNQGLFLGAYYQVFDTAMELGTFPRLRFGLNSVKRLLGGPDELEQ